MPRSGPDLKRGAAVQLVRLTGIDLLLRAVAHYALHSMEQVVTNSVKGTPAWPTLLGIQALVMMSLGGMLSTSYSVRTVEVSDLERRLVSLDIPTATVAVDHALETVETDAALTDGDVLRVTSFLALAGQASGLKVEDIRIEALEAGSATAGVTVVEAVIDITGDLYDLPIFVDGAHRQRAVGALQSLAFDVESGGDAKGQVRFRYHRPTFADTSWIGPHLMLAAPGAASAAGVLEKASTLSSWKAYNLTEEQRNRRAMVSRARAARELPPNLVTLRQTGGRFVWDADAGIAIR